MATSPGFQSLVGPLRYACEQEFARLSQVKNLAVVLRGAIAQAEEKGADAGSLAPLKAEIPFVDHRLPTLRKASLKRVARALRDLGVELPAAVAALANSPDALPAREEPPETG